MRRPTSLLLAAVLVFTMAGLGGCSSSPKLVKVTDVPAVSSGEWASAVCTQLQGVSESLGLIGIDLAEELSLTGQRDQLLSATGQIDALFAAARQFREAAKAADSARPQAPASQSLQREATAWARIFTAQASLLESFAGAVTALADRTGDEALVTDVREAWSVAALGAQEDLRQQVLVLQNSPASVELLNVLAAESGCSELDPVRMVTSYLG